MTALAIHFSYSRWSARDHASSYTQHRRRKERASVPEHSLLQRVAAGESAAVGETIERYNGLVWSLAQRLSPTRSEAEDAVQEIFISLWKSAGRFDPAVAQESTFVAMIARRRLIDRLRKSGRRPEISGTEFSEANAVTPGEASENTGLGGGEESRAVAAAFRQLSDDQQRVLRLSLQLGQSHSQITESTGMPLGTVKTHARRGLMKLKTILAAQRGEHVEVSA